MSLKERLLDNSTIDETAEINNSKIYGKKEMAPTEIPVVNIGLSGMMDGGLPPGLMQIAAPSKHFKSMFALMMGKAYMDKYEDAVMLFYDSEGGTPEGYFDFFEIDMDRVIYTPVKDIEEFKHDIMNQLKVIEQGDHVFILIDSVGNLASKKEVEDAIDGNMVADMTRAKALKSLGRMITPHLIFKEIPMIAVNHVYDELKMHPRKIVGGGTGLYLSAHTIWVLGRRQEKEGKDVAGYSFVINVEKSRYVKERSVLPVTVMFDGGIRKWSGLTDIAMELGYIGKPNMGWFQRKDKEGNFIGEKKYRAAQLDEDDEFWNDLLETTDFKEAVKEKFKFGE